MEKLICRLTDGWRAVFTKHPFKHFDDLPLILTSGFSSN